MRVCLGFEDDNIRKRIIEILEEQADLSPSDLGDDSISFSQLDLDSLDFADLIAITEEEFQVVIEYESLTGETSIGEFVRLVEKGMPR